MNIRAYIDGIEVDPPNNLNEVALIVEIDDNNERKLRFDGDLVWGRGDLRTRTKQDAYNYLDGKFQQGVAGAVGVMEASHVLITAEELGQTIVVLDALVDIWDATFKPEVREIVTPIMERGGQDWLISNTQGLSFEYLEAVGYIGSSDYILAPYVVELENQGLEKALAIGVGVSLVGQIRDQIQALVELASETSGVQPWVAVAKIILRLSYIAVLIKTLIDTIVRLINLLIQPVKYICGMTVKKHFEKVFGWLGYEFKSSIFNGDEQYLTIFPEKYSNPVNKDYDNIKGWIKPDMNKQKGFYNVYAFQFLQTFRQYYNGKFIVDQDAKIVYFERKDFVLSTANFTPPPVWEEYKLNKKDFFANHLFRFQTDINDRHTIQEYEGTSSSISIVKTISDQTLNLSTGGKIIDPPFSLFKVKTKLSDVEEIIKALLDVIDASLNLLAKVANAVIKVVNAVLSTINKIIKALAVVGIKVKANIGKITPLPKFNLSDTIENRVGMFKMESDIVNTPKLAYVKPQGSPRNVKQLKALRAEDIQEAYHSIDFFTRGNQYIQGNGFGIPINFAQIYDIIGADQLADGSRVVSLRWNMFDHTAELVFKRQLTYLSGLEEVRVIREG